MRLIIISILFSIATYLHGQERTSIFLGDGTGSSPEFDADSMGLVIPAGEIVIGTGSKAPGSSDSLMWNAGLFVDAPLNLTGLVAGTPDSSLYIDASGFVGKTALGGGGGGDSMGIVRPSGYLLIGQGNKLPDTSIALFYDMTGHRLGIGTNTPSAGAKLHLHEDVVPGGAITARFTNSTTGTTLFDGLYFGYGTEAFFLNYENTPLTFWTNGVKRLDIGASGTSTFSGNVVIPSLTLNTSDTILVRNNVTGEIQGRLASTIAGSDSLGRNGNPGQIVFETATKAGNSSPNFTMPTSNLVRMPQVVNTGFGSSTQDNVLELGIGRTGTGNAYIDMHAETAVDYSSRFLRNSGANGNFLVANSGTGNIVFRQEGAGNISFETAATSRMYINSVGNVGIGTSSPSASTKLEISSTTGAFLPPRMNSTQRDALTAVDGMVLFNSTTSKLQVRAGGAWVDLH